MIGDVVTVRTALPCRENRRSVAITDAQIVEVRRQPGRLLESKTRIELQAVRGRRDAGLNCSSLILQSLLLIFNDSFEAERPGTVRTAPPSKSTTSRVPRLPAIIG